MASLTTRGALCLSLRLLSVLIAANLFFGTTTLAQTGQQPDEDGSAQLSSARDLLKNGQPAQALGEFQHLIEIRQQLVPALFGAARASAELDQPEQALAYFRQVGELSTNNPDDKQAALFGTARMLGWLGHYRDAENIYRELLSQTLSPDDRNVAHIGLVRMLTLQDEPIAGYNSVPDAMSLSTEGRFERARAAHRAGWPEKSQSLLDQVDDSDAPPDSRLAKDIANLRRDVRDELGNPLSVQYYFSSDTDDLDIHRAEVSAGKYLGAARQGNVILQAGQFEQAGRSLHTESIQGRYAWRQNDQLWFSVQGGAAQYGDFNSAVGAANVIYRPSDRLRLEAGLAREAVETFAAIDDRISFNSLNISVDYRLTERVILIGSLFEQHFSDDNHRRGGTAKLVTILSEPHGLSLQLRGRYFNDSRDDVSAYFNPEHFSEAQILLNWRHRFNPDWRFEVIGGPGLQKIAGQDSANTSFVETRLTGRLAGCFSVNMMLGYTDSAGFNASGFSTRHGSIALACPW